jgi:hypothetical protein
VTNCYRYKCPVCGEQSLKGYDDRMECWNCWTVFDGSMCRSCPYFDYCEYYPKLGSPQVDRVEVLPLPVKGKLDEETISFIKEELKKV